MEWEWKTVTGELNEHPAMSTERGAPKAHMGDNHCLGVNRLYYSEAKRKSQLEGKGKT